MKLNHCTLSFVCHKIFCSCCYSESWYYNILLAVVTPKRYTAMKIRDMKDNKSQEVDGIPPKLLLKIVEQISIPLATVQFVIRGGNSSVRIERSKHYTII